MFLVRGNVTVYLTLVLNVTSVSSSIVHSLLHIERVVSFWSSLFPRLLSLPTTDLNQLLFDLDVVVIVKKDHLIPNKNKSTTPTLVVFDSISLLAFKPMSFLMYLLLIQTHHFLYCILGLTCYTCHPRSYVRVWWIVRKNERIPFSR